MTTDDIMYNQTPETIAARRAAFEQAYKWVVNDEAFTWHEEDSLYTDLNQQTMWLMFCAGWAYGCQELERAMALPTEYRPSPEQLLVQQGYKHVKDEHMFGFAPLYEKDGEQIYVHDGTVKSRLEMCRWLEVCWHPADVAQRHWFADHMHEDMGIELSDAYLKRMGRIV